MVRTRWSGLQEFTCQVQELSRRSNLHHMAMHMVLLCLDSSVLCTLGPCELYPGEGRLPGRCVAISVTDVPPQV